MASCLPPLHVAGSSLLAAGSSLPVSSIIMHVYQLGDVFTIQVAGKWMTFIMDPNLYHAFFSSNSVDFQAAVLPICKRVGMCQ